MGSVLSLPTSVSVVLIAGGIVYGFLQKRPPPPDWASPSNRAVLPGEVQPSETKGKKKKKASAKGGVQFATQTEVKPTVLSFPDVVPGGFEQPQQLAADTVASAASKSKKKKKGKKATSSAPGVPLDAQSDSSATAPESSTPVPRPAAKRKSTPVIEADGPWTRVEARKRIATQQQPASGSSGAPEPAASDTGITTSVTGTSSPVTERTEDEQALGTEDNRRTLAERLLPKPRKTHVEECVHAGFLVIDFIADIIAVCWKRQTYPRLHALCAYSRVQTNDLWQGSRGLTMRMSMSRGSLQTMLTARKKAGGSSRAPALAQVCIFN